MVCRVTIDTYRCNGCGSCVAICPDLFWMSEATEKAEAAEECLERTDDLEQAAVMCPVDCIELEEC